MIELIVGITGFVVILTLIIVKRSRPYKLNQLKYDAYDAAYEKAPKYKVYKLKSGEYELWLKKPYNSYALEVEYISPSRLGFWTIYYKTKEKACEEVCNAIEEINIYNKLEVDREVGVPVECKEDE